MGRQQRRRPHRRRPGHAAVCKQRRQQCDEAGSWNRPRSVIHADTNTGGALSRSKNGALFLAARGLNTSIMQLEPTRRVFASSFRGQPLECIGGVLNDLAADSRGGVYFTITLGGLFYANPQGVVAQ